MFASIVIFIAISFLITQVIRLKYYQSRFLSLLILSLVSFIFSHFFTFKYVFYTILLFFCILGIHRILKNGVFFEGREEGIFLLSLAYFLLLRSLVPDVIGAEKLMDIAFMNAVLKADSFPPLDPFFAGGTLNFYYYFGYVVGAAITLMSFVTPEVGFNIAIASVGAFSALLVYGFLKEVLKEKALFGVIFVLFSGNFYAAYELFNNAIAMQKPSFLFYWNATRVIDGTINEFPYFSFIHADFHAHVVAIPIKILAIALLYDYYRGSKISGLMLVPLAPILFLTNSWDAPIMLFLIALISFLKLDRWNLDELRFAVAIVAAAILSIVAFHSTMDVQAKFMFSNERTNLIQFLLFFSIQLAFAYLYLREEIRSMLFIFSLIISAILSLWIPIAIVILPIAAIAAKRAFEGDFLALLIFSATLLLIFPETFAIESRMNTVFKFYLTAWILLTIPGSMVFGIERKNILNAAVIVLFALSLAYPAIATPLRHYKADFSLDGMEFVKDISEGDYKAIQWLRDKKGITLEAAAECYGYGGRIAAFTGNPTVIGWACHEVQWRGNGELAGRMADVRAIYTSYNCPLVTNLLEKYNVSYVVVGYEEKRVYNTEAEKFRKCLVEVFAWKGTHIFQV
jgi:YYY domain-containing protein